MTDNLPDIMWIAAKNGRNYREDRKPTHWSGPIIPYQRVKKISTVRGLVQMVRDEQDISQNLRCEIKSLRVKIATLEQKLEYAKHGLVPVFDGVKPVKTDFDGGAT